MHLEVPWPSSPPLQQQTQLVGSYFLLQQHSTVKHKLPVFPDFVTELTHSWPSLKAPVSLPFTQFLDLEGMETAGLTNIPPMDETLAYHLAPKANMASNKPTLPSKQCRFSASQLEKIYRAQGCQLARLTQPPCCKHAKQKSSKTFTKHSPRGRIQSLFWMRSAELLISFSGFPALLPLLWVKAWLKRL
ncbi:hypothetical protein LDENG_00159540 [Lucifuga dentata]|nr:hypothetical protein LDENG_00159540 [Lucifuga dentata]